MITVVFQLNSCVEVKQLLQLQCRITACDFYVCLSCLCSCLILSFYLFFLSYHIFWAILLTDCNTQWCTNNRNSLACYKKIRSSSGTHQAPLELPFVILSIIFIGHFKPSSKSILLGSARHWVTDIQNLSNWHLSNSPQNQDTTQTHNTNSQHEQRKLHRPQLNSAYDYILL